LSLARLLYMIYEVVTGAHGGLTLEQEKDLAEQIARYQNDESTSYTLEQGGAYTSERFV
jgi:hypothetical protein